MRILITGGAGFVGRRFCKALLQQGHEVVCVDKLAEHTGGIDPKAGWFNFNPFEYEQFSFIKDDCRNYFIKNSHAEFDEVYHLAAMVGGRLMIEHFPLAVADDLAIDAMYFQWAKTAKIGKTIYFSSSAAYPISLQTKAFNRPLVETDINLEGDIGKPDMTYGWAKLTGEYLARVAHQAHGMNSVVYRPFSGFGEDQDLAYPFPSICLRALENHDPKTFKVWGSGQQIRDFIHIEDCVRGVLSTKDAVNDGSAINLSNGIAISFIDLAKKVNKVLGHDPMVTGVSDKPEGVFARVGDRALQENLNFYPKISLEEGIKMTLKYFEQKGC